VGGSVDVLLFVTAELVSPIDEPSAVLTVVLAVDSALPSDVVVAGSWVIVSVDVEEVCVVFEGLSMGIVGSSGSTVIVGSSGDEVDELGSVSGGVVGIETVDSVAVVVESSLDAMAMSAQFLYSS